MPDCEMVYCLLWAMLVPDTALLVWCPGLLGCSLMRWRQDAEDFSRSLYISGLISDAASKGCGL